jgi:hypothetical protein
LLLALFFFSSFLLFLFSSSPHFFLSVCAFHVVSIFLTGGSFGECLNISDHLVSTDKIKVNSELEECGKASGRSLS